jgi:hypothetical protein
MERKEARMVAERMEIHVDPESEVGKLLAQARERPLRVVSGGESYRVEAVGDEAPGQVEDVSPSPYDPLAGQDPERAAAAWRATFGVWRGMDLEALKAELKEQRGQDSVGRPEW